MLSIGFEDVHLGNNILMSFMVRSFSLPDFAAEIEEVIKPVLNAYSEVNLRF